MFIRYATFLTLFSLLPALGHALAGLPPVTRGKKGPTADPRKVYVKGYNGVVFPGNGGMSVAKYDLVDGGSGEVNMAGKTLTPYLSRNDLDPSGEKHDFGFDGEASKSPKLVTFIFKPTCHFNGKLTGDGDITFSFAPTTDFLFPCGDSQRGLEIVCDWNGKPADCLNKPFQ